ncbi:MG(2+) CHELATASE FAMILY PROTEIN / ComM-related protein [hydrothermal vent metagenome]|uniref:MG(2+) CHELATASE FAMILY PROTEIN / ComM-related protein n=1 Tax=hydrothermal vent metagenome TaxID=652676 RepID=A0A3B1CML1_9ZZZZ
MSVSLAQSAAVYGVDAYMVEVEADLSPGLFYYSTVGLPDAAVRESQNRVLSALTNSGFETPIKRITINLAPADIRKEGSTFDLPIAIAILKAEGFISADIDDSMIFGELALDGRVKPIRGMLSAAIMARDHGLKRIITPIANAKEAAVVDGIEVIGVSSLPQALQYLKGDEVIEPTKVPLDEVFRPGDFNGLDFSEVKGQSHVKRALEVAAAGGHNVLLIGPPGSGKSMMAKRMPTILPDFTFEESIETTRIHSVSGKLGADTSLVAHRPFRAPHHTISDAGLIGGGTVPMPGEVSLSHNGVLFLDEFPEFKRNALEALRQPLEDGDVTISRSAMTVTFPSRFMLAAAMNPCPCGYFTDSEKECVCTGLMIRKYRSRISGPLMDRIDLHVDTPAVKYRDMMDEADGEPSSAIRDRVNKARNRQIERFKGKKIHCNARMSAKMIKTDCALDQASKAILKAAVEKLGLSARAHEKALKVARTIADLAGSEKLKSEHVAEAVQYRSLDREVY